ncbi:MAG: hypothetical protein H0V09_02820 [Gemmatimonadetes bacterium]|nr:hypothetical protein [Gemmatimonadota bacterium]
MYLRHEQIDDTTHVLLLDGALESYRVPELRPRVSELSEPGGVSRPPNSYE